MSNGLRQEDPVRLLLEKDAVISAMNKLFRTTDERDWESVAACFAPTVMMDMTSVVGGEPEMTTADQIAAGWRAGLAHLDAVHHQTGNYEVQVRGNEADAVCHGIASHFPARPSGRNARTFVGTYDVHLRKLRGGWRIDRFRFNLRFVDGDPDLEGMECADSDAIPVSGPAPHR